jgi:peptide/nickel transport system permease protein
MMRYLIRRTLWVPVILFGISAVCFLIMYVVPLDPARAYAGYRAQAETVESVRRELGLDQPLYLQYVRYFERLLHGDLGRSYHFGVPVLPAILQRVPATAQLAVAGVLMQLAIGLPVGFVSAVRRYSWFDRLGTVGSLMALSAPPFWMGLLLLYFLAFRLRLFPLGGYGGVRYLFLPALTIGISFAPWYARMFRSALIDAMTADYVRTARAKGLAEVVVFGRHIMRNAINPIVTMMGMDLGQFMSGVLVVEIVFGWPGIGRLAWDGLVYLDVPLIMGTVLFAAALIVLLNLAVDVFYGVIDPRIRYE